MRQTLATMFMLLLLGAGLPTHALSADSGWISRSQAEFQAKRMRITGEIPVDVDCKRESAKPVYRIKSAANTDNRNWVLIVMDDPYVWRAGEVGSFDDWKKIASKMVQSPSGAHRHCSLYHHKQADTFDRSPPIITRFAR